MTALTQKERYEESKKLLVKYKDEKLRITMVEYGEDPNGYTRNGMIDWLATRMSEFKEEPAEEPTPEPEEKPKKSKKKPKAAPVEEPPVEEKPKKKAKKPKEQPPPEPTNHFTGGKITEKTPGVCLFVVHLLLGASKEKPLTKKQIQDAVCEKFPERDQERLRNKAGNCKSWMKIHYNMDLSEKRTMDGKAYWLEQSEYDKGAAWIAKKKQERKSKKGAGDEAT